MSENILELKDINFSYDNIKQTLNNINLSFKKGEKVAVLGSNGAGKSTLFLSCNGVLSPDSGTIMLNGNRLSKNKNHIINLRRTVGIVFQNPDHQFIAPTVEGEISFGPLNLGNDMESVKQIIDKTCNILEISHLLKRAPHTLSGGEKKLVSIASVLAMEPEMILFDEPTAGVDPKNITIFEDVLNKLNNKKMTTVIATHDVDFAWRWADRIVVMHKGEVLKDGQPYDVFMDTNILKQSGLFQPLVLQFGNILRDHGLTAKSPVRPKIMDDIERIFI